MWVNKLSTKKYSHNLKVQSYFIWLECQDSERGRQHLRSSGKTAPRRQGKVRLYTSLRQREQAVWTAKIRYQAKDLASVHGKMRPSFLSHAPRLFCLVHPASCVPPAPQQNGAGIQRTLQDQFGELSFTFGGQDSPMAVIFLAYVRRITLLTTSWDSLQKSLKYSSSSNLQDSPFSHLYKM